MARHLKCKSFTTLHVKMETGNAANPTKGSQVERCQCCARPGRFLALKEEQYIVLLRAVFLRSCSLWQRLSRSWHVNAMSRSLPLFKRPTSLTKPQAAPRLILPRRSTPPISPSRLFRRTLLPISQSLIAQAALALTWLVRRAAPASAASPAPMSRVVECVTSAPTASLRC